MGQSEALRQFVSHVWREVTLPVVIDADGLNNLATDSNWSRLPSPAPRVLTPHPGEMQRLSGVASSDRDGQKKAAIELARRTDATICAQRAPDLGNGWPTALREHNR